MSASFTATRESLATHALPAWFDEAKFGIMIHWGIFTVPAWAETVLDPADWLADLTKLLAPPDYGREWFTHIPYSEWYPNTILIDGSPAQAHHRATYGAAFAYEEFRPAFDAAAAAWSAAPWADLFRDAGARYVVLVTKHHDGYALWPTAVPHPRRPGWHATRDFVGELTAAVRARCMRMGLYYSGGLDWSAQPGPITNTLDLVWVRPPGPEYVAYADGQWRELIARYRPAVLWNDIGYPPDGDELALFADCYNAIPDGVVNDRFGLLPGLTHQDYVTPEFSVVRDISAQKFETVRGMGHGFGYNRNETEYDSAAALIHLLVDVVSRNGNLLLNVGPHADGTIPPAQVERLRAIGRWLDVNGEAIYATRPWARAEGRTADGTPVRFTARDETVYAVVLGPLAAGGTLGLSGFGATPGRVRLLGSPGDLSWTRDGDDLRVVLPPSIPPEPAHVLAVDS
jgi:alpha-L-fucosidase